MIPEAVPLLCLGAAIWIVGFATAAHWLSTGAFRSHFGPASYVIAALWPVWFVPIIIYAAATTKEVP